MKTHIQIEVEEGDGPNNSVSANGVTTSSPSLLLPGAAVWLTDIEAVEYVRQDAALIGFYHAQRRLGYSVRVALVRTYRRMLEADRQRWQDLLNSYDSQAENQAHSPQPTRPKEVTDLIEELRADFKLYYSEESLGEKSGNYFWFLENWQPGNNSVARSLKLAVAPLS